MFWPVAGVNLGVEIETWRTGHQPRSEVHTLVVEAAVGGMRKEYREAVITLMTDHIKLGLSVERLAGDCHSQHGEDGQYLGKHLLSWLVFLVFIR